MQVSVEKVSSVECRLTIVVPFDQVEEAYVKKIAHYAKSANLKGFRPGKAPLSYVTQRFGADARKEALSSVIENAFHTAITKENLKPLGAPQIEPKMMTPNNPLEFIASFEVLPEIEKVNFSMDSIEKWLVTINQDEVKGVIEKLRKQYANWRVVDRAAEMHDRVVIDYHTPLPKKSNTENHANTENQSNTEHHANAENHAKDFSLELGSQTMLPGFEEGLLGMQVGDERTLHLSFPDPFPDQEKAGTPIDFIVQLKQIFVADIPAFDEEFIKKLGIKSGLLEDFNEQIRKSLEQERDRLVKEKLKDQIFRQLLEQNPLDVPRVLVTQEANRIHDELYAEDHHHKHSDHEMTELHVIAKKRVALSLLIAAYTKQFNLKADEQQVKQRIQTIASNYENPHEVMAWLSTDDRRGGIESQVMEDQVLDKLMESITIVEKPISFAELKGMRV